VDICQRQIFECITIVSECLMLLIAKRAMFLPYHGEYKFHFDLMMMSAV